MILLGVAVVLFSSLLTLANGLTFLVKQFRSTLGYSVDLRQAIRQLCPGVTIGYFRSVLGSETFVTTRQNRREHVFTNKLSYIQAVTDLEGTVLAFSVTTRKKRFTPQLTLGQYSLYGEKLRVRLGKTSFSRLTGFANPNELSSSLGAHSFHYSEEFYFGNPGKYQTLVFSINDAGHCEYVRPPNEDEIRNGIDDEAVSTFRAKSVINTYTVIAPLISSRDAMGGFWFGPDRQQVRTLEGAEQRISRHQMKRIKQIYQIGPYRYLRMEANMRGSGNPVLW